MTRGFMTETEAMTDIITDIMTDIMTDTMTDTMTEAMTEVMIEATETSMGEPSRGTGTADTLTIITTMSRTTTDPSATTAGPEDPGGGLYFSMGIYNQIELLQTSLQSQKSASERFFELPE